MSNNNPSTNERLTTEIELLHAMYPDQIIYSPKSNELKFTHDDGSTLTLRLPEKYPTSGLPDVISAVDSSKRDIRQEMKNMIATTSTTLQIQEGEEILDSIIQVFQDLISSDSNERTTTITTSQSTNSNPNLLHSDSPSYKTVIIWLHHLLATSKRKLALNPSLTHSHSTNQISGLTKPGYPGILLFTGPTSLIDAHVAELKNQRWQAFQVRFEEETESQRWRFEHGKGIVEFETLAEVVRDIVVDDGDETWNNRREEFLKAVGVK